MTRTQERRQVPFKAVNAFPDFDADLDGPSTPARDADDPWNYDIASAPADGTEVALKLTLDGADYRVCRWRMTSRVMNFKWCHIEGWSDAVNRQMLLDLAPVAWARYDMIHGVVKGV